MNPIHLYQKQKYLISKLLKNISVSFNKLIYNRNIDFFEIQEFLKWTFEKANFHFNSPDIPLNFLPSKIDEFQYNLLHQNIKDIVNKYYIHKIRDKNKIYLLKFSVNIPYSEKLALLNSLVLRRGSVIWVDYGFNIGVEFRGRHPALILKNTGNSLVVVPLSSTIPKFKQDYFIIVEQVYNFPLRRRSIDLRRITNIDFSRISYTSYGHVAGNVMDSVNAGIKTLLNL